MSWISPDGLCRTTGPVLPQTCTSLVALPAEEYEIFSARHRASGHATQRLSCHSFEANQVRLPLHVLAYNLGNFLRRLASPPRVKHWTLTTRRDKRIKIGSKAVYHARYVTFQRAEVAVPRRLYRAILERMRRFTAIAPRAAPIGPDAGGHNPTKAKGALPGLRPLRGSTACPGTRNADFVSLLQGWRCAGHFTIELSLGRAVYWCLGRSALSPGEGHRGNVGLAILSGLRISR